MKLSLKFGSDLLFIILYKLLLDYTYTSIQVSLFGYNGFLNDGPFHRCVIGWIIYLIIYAIIATEDCDTSVLFVHVIFLVSIAPFISLYQYDTRCKLWMLISQCVCLIYMNTLFEFGKRTTIKAKKLKGVDYQNTTFRLIVFAIIVAYFGMALIKFGIPSLSSLSFEEVYNTRSSVNLSTFQSIIQNAVCRIICPLSMLILFGEKKWIPFTILSIVQIYTYAVTGFKTYLFIPILLIGLQFMPDLNLRKTIVRGLPAALVMLIIVYNFTHNAMIYAILGNRLFFLPAKIKYAYFDYFNNNQFVYFSQNSISKILGIKSNYEVRIPYLIGRVYFNKPNMWTNTGFMADAYANLGIIGMLLMCGLLAAALNLLIHQLKYVSRDIQKELQALFVTFFISLNDGATISVLFSGGLLFAILVVCYVQFNDTKCLRHIS